MGENRIAGIIDSLRTGKVRKKADGTIEDERKLPKDLMIKEWSGGGGGGRGGDILSEPFKSLNTLASIGRGFPDAIEQIRMAEGRQLAGDAMNAQLRQMAGVNMGGLPNINSFMPNNAGSRGFGISRYEEDPYIQERRRRRQEMADEIYSLRAGRDPEILRMMREKEIQRADIASKISLIKNAFGHLFQPAGGGSRPSSGGSRPGGASADR